MLSHFQSEGLQSASFEEGIDTWLFSSSGHCHSTTYFALLAYMKLFDIYEKQ